MSTAEREPNLTDVAALAARIIRDMVPQYIELVTGLLEIADTAEPAHGEGMIQGLRALCLSSGVPLLQTARMLADRGAALASDDPLDDPRVLLPLIREMGESYVSLAGIGQIGDVRLAYAAPPDAIRKLIHEPHLNDWLLRQRAKGRLPPQDADRDVG